VQPPPPPPQLLLPLSRVGPLPDAPLWLMAAVAVEMERMSWGTRSPARGEMR